MSENLEEPMADNPNFDKEYFKREMERFDFLQQEDMGNNNFMASFEEMERIRMQAHDPGMQVKMIKDGT